MSTSIYLYHHGDFTPPPNSIYIGGKVDIIRNIAINLISFRYLQEFGEKYDYDGNSLLYFKTDGHSFKKGTRLVYDDKSVRDLVELYKPRGKIELYVDHFDLDELIDVPQTPKQNINDKKMESETVGHDTEEVEDDRESDDTEDPDDPEYMEETDDSDSDSEGLHPDDDVTDEEIESIMQNKRKFKDSMYNAMNIPNKSPSEESDYDSQTIRSLSSSSEDENSKIGYIGPPNPRKRKLRMKRGTSEGIIKWEVGQRFVNMKEFRDAVRNYGVSERRGIQFVTNDAKRCQVCCEGDCPFYIWCSRDKDNESCTIKTLVDSHLCTKPYTNKMASVKYLCEVFGDRLRKNPQWKIKEMAETIKNELEIEVPRIKILRLRKAALEGVAESLRQHYGRLRDYGHEILLSNPLNTVKISTTRLNENDPAKFKRFYVCYHALKSGWKIGCRPVIGLDGCFLKTVTGGQLLSAVGRDGNNQMFPICYAIVESENTDSWRWFLDLLRDDLDLVDGHGFTIISDQQKGLENAVKELLPCVEHRFCTRHLCVNFKKRFSSNLLRNIFWSVACATHKGAHTRAMKVLERTSKAAHEELSKLDPKVWCKAFFSTHSLVDSTDNNMSESFNSWIINERYMPILTMLQEIQFKLMTRMRLRRDEMLASGVDICPRIKKRLDYFITESRKWSASWDGSRKFQVKSGSRSVTVDLERRNCDCRVFDLTGIPCQHAIAAIHSRRHQPVAYVSEYYKRDKYLATYNNSLEAMKGDEYWDFHSTDELLPPDIPKKLRGRPKKLRRREDWEGGSRSQTQAAKGVLLQRFTNKRVMHCSHCRQAGHRVGKCPTKAQENASNAGQAQEPVQQQAAKQKSAASTPKKKTAKELKRNKLSVRRPTRGIVINEGAATQASQTRPTIIIGKGKGKKKVVEEVNTEHYADEEDVDLGIDEDVMASMNEELFGQMEDVGDAGKGTETADQDNAHRGEDGRLIDLFPRVPKRKAYAKNK